MGGIDNREGCACVGKGVYGESLYFLFDFAGNLKMPFKKSDKI